MFVLRANIGTQTIITYLAAAGDSCQNAAARVLGFTKACGGMEGTIEVMVFVGAAGKNHHKRRKFRSAESKRESFARRRCNSSH